MCETINRGLRVAGSRAFLLQYTYREFIVIVIVKCV